MQVAVETDTPIRRTGQRLAGWHVLAGFVGFFAIVIAVNAAMIYSAVSTYSGVVAAEPYRKGLHYNDRVRASELQQQLGWRNAIAVDRSGKIEIRIVQADGIPLGGLDVQMALGRPSTNREDARMTLVEASGVYATHAGELQPGSWVVALEVRRSKTDSEPLYRARHRIWLAP